MKVHVKSEAVKEDTSWPTLKYYPNICQKGLREIFKNLKITIIEVQTNVGHIINVASKSIVKTTETVKRLGFVSTIPYQPSEHV